MCFFSVSIRQFPRKELVKSFHFFLFILIFFFFSHDLFLFQPICLMLNDYLIPILRCFAKSEIL